ncbi:MAG: MarR family transcriptional regulator [Erysipelothrix sp.]|nr:MarR family transcriptional regulator [Erysipelothrix sp.]
MLEKDLAIYLRNTQEKLKEIMRGKLQDYDLSYRLILILSLIKEDPLTSQKELAEKMKLTQGALSVSIKELLCQNMLEQIPLEEDKRYNRLKITELGHNTIKQCIEDIDARYRILFSNFTNEELQDFYDKLEKLNHNIDEINTKEKEGVIL